MKVNYETKLEALTRYILAISTLRKDSITNADALTLSLIILSPSKHIHNPLSPLQRRKLENILKISAANLQNRIYSLHKNDYLYRDEDNLFQIKPFFRNLKEKPLTLNVSYTYDQTGIPDDTFAIAESIYKGGVHRKSNTPPLQESTTDLIES
jgi:hypothetical protein